MTSWHSLAAAALLCTVLASPAAAQSPPAITGHISSAEEGPMEGVLVTARRDGAQFAISVSTDERGVYAFPESHVAPGRYSIVIRAVGYELQSAAATDVRRAQTSTLDLRLRKTGDLSQQLTSTEWFMSWPGTDQQKEAVYSCTNCHSVERIARSHHNAEEWLQVFVRMASYANMTTDTHPQKRVTAPNPSRFGAEIKNLAAYLATVNLSATPEWAYEFKTLPRIKGRGNRAIVTEYFLPRARIQPHDVIVDADGIVWYSNFGELNLGRFDPKTSELQEYPLPLHRPGYPEGQLDLEFDRDGNLWMGLMYQGGVAKFDKKTRTMRTWYLPADQMDEATQLNQVAVNNSHIDGKIWTTNVGLSGIHRLDLTTGKWETFDAYVGQPKNRRRGIYQVVSDSQNNAWFSDYAGQDIGKIDARTGVVTLFQGPTPRARPRRIRMDAQDRVWFAEFGGEKIGVFDTRAETFREWPVPTPYSAPYDVVPDRNGEVWTSGMENDRVQRLDPRTGTFVEYLMPPSRDPAIGRVNVRRVFVDNATNPVTFWVGNNHGASIIKIEPGD
jgi:virginiamycin B lyase